MAEPLYQGIARELDNEVQRLRGAVDAQDKALMHWRREADKDAGKIARYERALRTIAETAPELWAEVARKELVHG